MPVDELQARIEDIEASYEFFLAYAAQGLSTHEASKSGAQLTEFLEKMEAALDDVADRFRIVVAARGLEPHDRYEALIGVLEDDALKARAAVRLVAIQPAISSQLIDNLNASIHVRALLTDLFLLDEVVGE